MFPRAPTSSSGSAGTSAVGTGTVTLTSTPSGGGGPGPDECAGAVPLLDGVSRSFDTSSATSSAPAWPCAGSGGSDIWYSYTTALSGSDVTTCGSSYDTAVEIFSGSCGSLTSLACNDDACARQSTATATGLSSGTTLLIRVGGYNGLSGAGTVELTESGGGTPGCGSLPDDAFEDNDDCPRRRGAERRLLPRPRRLRGGQRLLLGDGRQRRHPGRVDRVRERERRHGPLSLGSARGLRHQRRGAGHRVRRARRGLLGLGRRDDHLHEHDGGRPEPHPRGRHARRRRVQQLRPDRDRHRRLRRPDRQTTAWRTRTPRAARVR